MDFEQIVHNLDLKSKRKSVSTKDHRLNLYCKFTVHRPPNFLPRYTRPLNRHDKNKSPITITEKHTQNETLEK